MTWRERRIVTFLSGVLGILLIALLLVLGMKYRENRDEEEAAVSAAAVLEEESACTALSYYNGTAMLDFTRNQKNQWIWAADDDFPLDETFITDILDSISDLAPQETYESVESLEALGLDNPRSYLSASYQSGTTFSISFGSTTADGSGVYAIHNEKTAPVYLYSAEVLDLLNYGVYDMCVLPDFPELPEERIQRITIQGTANAEGVVPRFTMDSSKNGEKLIWKCESRTVTNAQRVRNLFTDLPTLEFTKCISYRPSEEAAALCGFNAPIATIWANYTTATDLEEHFQLVIGDLTLDGQSRYVRLNGEETIYSVSLDMLDAILVIAQNGFGM